MSKRKDRKTWTTAQKIAAVADAEGGMSFGAVLKKHGISSQSMLALWRKNMRETGSPSRKETARQMHVVSMPPQPLAKIEIRHNARDAILFLRKAKSELLKGIRNGTVDDLDTAHLFLLLALHSLQQGEPG